MNFTTKNEKLKRMQFIATGLLCVMALFMIISKICTNVHPFFHYLEAFSEAGVVGALADWFAVVALFRHPLGMRFIPHTAIIPRNKNSIASSLGGFLNDNFLSRENLESRINISFFKLFKDYLKNNKDQVASIVAHKILPVVLKMLDEMNLSEKVTNSLQKKLEDIKLAPMAGEFLDHVMTDERYESLIRDFLGMLRELLQKDRDAVKLLVQNELPSALSMMPMISDMVSEKIIGAVDKFLSQKMEEGNEGELDYTATMAEGIKGFVEKLKSSPEYIEKGEEIKERLLSGGKITEYVEKTWVELRDKAISDTNDPDSKIRQKTSELIDIITNAMENDIISKDIDDLLSGAILDLIDANKEKVRVFIEETVNNWDEKEISEKLEIQVGSDLQYIRLNGTIIGGLAGLMIKIISDLVTYFL